MDTSWKFSWEWRAMVMNIKINARFVYISHSSRIGDGTMISYTVTESDLSGYCVRPKQVTENPAEFI